jgi:small subunit ribosomal protein S15
MARMHSRKRGKSGSHNPITKVVPSWVTYKPKEVEMLVGKLAKKGLTASTIGIELRDSYGIPSVSIITSKTITTILKEKKLTKELPEDLLALMGKFVEVTKHIEENRQDKTAKRGLQLTTSKINRLVKYYKKTGAIDKTWKFNTKQASFYID